MSQKELLLYIKNLLDENSIQFWLQAGTLLGAVREGDFLKHDPNDIDIGLDYKNYWKVRELIEKDENLQFKYIWNREIAICPKNKANPKLDLFFYTFDFQYAYCYAYKPNKSKGHKGWNVEWRMKYPKELFMNLQKIPFLDTEFLAPEPYNYLELHYGHDWNIPQEKWDFTEVRPVDEDYKEIAFIIPSFLRFEKTKKEVESILNTYDSRWYKLYIGDQGQYSEEKEKYWNYLKSLGHKIIKLPYNCGLSYARNTLISLSTEPYILITDNDFLYDKNVNLCNFIDILNTDKELGLIAGQIYKYKKNPIVSYNYNLEIDKEKGKIYYIKYKENWKNSINTYFQKPKRFCYSDLVLNFFLAKREIFDDIQWDNNLKMAEHLDFFIRLKDTSWKSAFTDSVIVKHQIEPNSDIYNSYRHWKNGKNIINSTELVLKKYNLQSLNDIIHISAEEYENKYKINDVSNIACICVNFLRPEATKQCIKSLKDNYPNINIYVADQDNPSDDMIKFYEENNVKYWFVEHDWGLSNCRNFLVEQTTEDYILWGDNDFIYDNKCNFHHALEIFKEKEEVGIIGGVSVEMNGKKGHYERILLYDNKYQILVSVPLEYTNPPKYYTESNNILFYYADVVYNFALARKEIFKNEKIKWDSEIKVRFEHSVTGETPILCKRKNGDMFVSSIEDLIPKSLRHKRRKIYKDSGIQVWTEFGWEEVESINQYKVKNKPMCELSTTNSYINLTQDHSLVIKGKEVLPSNINIGDSIELNEYPALYNDINVDEDWAWFLGFFLAEGHYSTLDYSSASITNQNEKDFKRCQLALEKFGFKTKFWNTKVREDKCRFLVIENNKILNELFSQFYDSAKRKIVPRFVYNWNKKSREYFLNGFFKGDGHFYYKEVIQFSQKSEVTVQGILCLCKDIYPYYSLSKQKNKYGEWFAVKLHKWNENNIQKNKLLKPKNILKKKRDYIYSGWVYDISIKNKHHSFSGGIGNVNLHNSSFFQHVKRESKYRVVYCPSMHVWHNRASNNEYRKYRFRRNDGDIYRNIWGLNLSFCLGKENGGWDFDEQRLLTFKEIELKNNFLIDSDIDESEINKNEITSELKNENTKNKENNLILPIINVLKLFVESLEDYKIDYLLTEKTCKEYIKGTSFTSPLFIEANLNENAINNLYKNGFNVINSKYIKYQNIEINIAKYTTKKWKYFNPINGKSYKVPFPVIAYLKNKYGKNWEKA